MHFEFYENLYWVNAECIELVSMKIKVIEYILSVGIDVIYVLCLCHNILIS